MTETDLICAQGHRVSRWPFSFCPVPRCHCEEPPKRRRCGNDPVILTWLHRFKQPCKPQFTEMIMRRGGSMTRPLTDDCGIWNAIGMISSMNSFCIFFIKCFVGGRGNAPPLLIPIAMRLYCSECGMAFVGSLQKKILYFSGSGDIITYHFVEIGGFL